MQSTKSLVHHPCYVWYVNWFYTTQVLPPKYFTCCLLSYKINLLNFWLFKVGKYFGNYV